jgi:hypothetical protein
MLLAGNDPVAAGVAKSEAISKFARHHFSSHLWLRDLGRHASETASTA